LSVDSYFEIALRAAPRRRHYPLTTVTKLTSKALRGRRLRRVEFLSMNEPIFLAVSLRILAGRRSEFESTVRQMVAETKQEHGTLVYEFYVTEDAAECRLLEGYVDNDAAAAHLTGPVVTGLVPKLLESATLEAFEVYGRTSPQLVEIVADFRAKLFGIVDGFRR
jgi:quinol monooxygenase YgiN